VVVLWSMVVLMELGGLAVAIWVRLGDRCQTVMRSILVAALIGELLIFDQAA
jgi:hypothetical protein